MTKNNFKEILEQFNRERLGDEFQEEVSLEGVIDTVAGTTDWIKVVGRASKFAGKTEDINLPLDRSYGRRQFTRWEKARWIATGILAAGTIWSAYLFRETSQQMTQIVEQRVQYEKDKKKIEDLVQEVNRGPSLLPFVPDIFMHQQFQDDYLSIYSEDIENITTLNSLLQKHQRFLNQTEKELWKQLNTPEAQGKVRSLAQQYPELQQEQQTLRQNTTWLRSLRDRYKLDGMTERTIELEVVGKYPLPEVYSHLKLSPEDEKQLKSIVKWFGHYQIKLERVRKEVESVAAIPKELQQKRQQAIETEPIYVWSLGREIENTYFGTRVEVDGLSLDGVLRANAGQKVKVRIHHNEISGGDSGKQKVPLYKLNLREKVYLEGIPGRSVEEELPIGDIIMEDIKPLYSSGDLEVPLRGLRKGLYHLVVDTFATGAFAFQELVARKTIPIIINGARGLFIPRIQVHGWPGEEQDLEVYLQNIGYQGAVEIQVDYPSGLRTIRKMKMASGEPSASIRFPLPPVQWKIPKDGQFSVTASVYASGKLMDRSMIPIVVEEQHWRSGGTLSSRPVLEEIREVYFIGLEPRETYRFTLGEKSYQLWADFKWYNQGTTPEHYDLRNLEVRVNNEPVHFNDELQGKYRGLTLEMDVNFFSRPIRLTQGAPNLLIKK